MSSSIIRILIGLIALTVSQISLACPSPPCPSPVDPKNDEVGIQLEVNLFEL